MKRNAITALAMLLLGTVALALQGQSASFRARIEALTQGGGGSSSTSLVAGQQALAQTSGSLSSNSFSMRAGVVQPVIQASTSPSAWQLR